MSASAEASPAHTRYPPRRSVDKAAASPGQYQQPLGRVTSNASSVRVRNPTESPTNSFLTISQKAGSTYRERTARDNYFQPTDFEGRSGQPIRANSMSQQGSYVPASMAQQQQQPPYSTPRQDSYSNAQVPPTRPGASRGLSFYDMKQQQKMNRSTDSSAPNSVSGRDLYGARTRPGKNEPKMGWVMWMNSNFKNHFVATVGEFVGTLMFLFFAFAATQVANIDTTTTGETTTNATPGFNPSKLLYISLSFGFSLMVNVWIFFRISGGLFNPAVSLRLHHGVEIDHESIIAHLFNQVTLALLVTGAIGLGRALVLFIAQIAGSIAASALVLGLFPAKLNVQTTLSSETSPVRGVFIEAFLTA